VSKLFPGTHIYEVEYRCSCCGKLPPNFYIDGEISIEYAILFSCFEQIRDGYGNLYGLKNGKAIPINRGYSCSKHQLHIFLRKVREKYGALSDENIIKIINETSMTPYSVHIFGIALDIMPPIADIFKVVQIAKKTKPKLRIGWKAYQNNFHPHIHIDVGWMICPKYSKKLREGAEW